MSRFSQAPALLQREEEQAEPRDPGPGELCASASAPLKSTKTVSCLQTGLPQGLKMAGDNIRKPQLPEHLLRALLTVRHPWAPSPKHGHGWCWHQQCWQRCPLSPSDPFLQPCCSARSPDLPGDTPEPPRSTHYKANHLRVKQEWPVLVWNRNR